MLITKCAELLRIVTLSIFFVLKGGAHTDDIDYASFFELAEGIQSDIRGEKNIPHRGLKFLYKGPWGWSDPEYRFTADIEKNYSVEYIELEQQSISQANELWDLGVRTYEVKPKNKQF